MTEDFFFYLFGGSAVLATVFMIVTKNVIHGAYALTIVLLNLAAIYVLLNAEFMAVVQIFMYAGGVVVLLVFGIMLTNRSRKGPPITNHRQVIVSSFVSISVLALLGYVTMKESMKWSGGINETDTVTHFGIIFMTNHLLSFELIAVLLLMALVGAAYLAKKSAEE